MFDNGKEPWLLFDNYRLHRRRRALEKNGERLRLTPRVFDLLVLLVDRAGEVVTKEELLETVWADAVVEEGNINRTVSTLRKYLGKQTDGTDFIETVPRVGYRFLADVRIEPDSAKKFYKDELPPLGASETSRAVRSRRTFRWIGVAGVIAVAAVSLAVWKWWPTRLQKSLPAKNTIVKLLDSPDEEVNLTVSSDGRLRFSTISPDKSLRPFSMAADGSDVRLETSVPELATGRWSPDGTKVFFIKNHDKKFYLANADGSDERVMPFSPGNAMWSPDGKSYLYQATATNSEVPNNSDIFIYSLETGIITPVVESLAFDGDPSYSPDGRSIAFVSDRDGNFEVYTMDLATRETHRMTDHPAHDSFPSFSPDGTQIIFNSDREKENADVYLMNSDGSGLMKITDSPEWDAAPTGCWSADGTKIFVYNDSDGDPDIFAIDIEPFVPRKIFEAEMDGTAFPSYSPDGRSVVYQTAKGNDSEIRIFDISAGESHLVTKAEGPEVYPSFAPDGASILFQDKVGDNTEICIIGIDGSGRRNLTNNPAKDINPRFSPDGKMIAFSTNRGGSSQLYEIFLMNADGSDQHQLFGDRAMSANPSYSADGATIFFSNDREGGRVGNFEIFAIPSSGGTVTRLTDRRRADSQPSVSPDGKRIAFTSDTDGNSEIYVMNVDGSQLLRLTRDLATDNCPRWSPDGGSIIFNSNRGGKIGIYQIEVNRPTT